jgi:hypothetical protein
MKGPMIAGPITLAVWLALYSLLPPIPGMADAASRAIFALKCCCIAVLLCFLTGIEAVAHERLNTPAINPLLGRESARMKVNLHYLQNTLEQLLVFMPGLIALACYCADGHAMRAVVATTIVWMLSRAVFWVGYHRAPRFRAAGLTGMVQSLLVLVYVCGHFGYEIAGPIGASVPIVIFAGVEAYLVYMSTRPARPAS